MKTIRYVLGCCLLLLAPSPGHSDACSDLQAAIAKATVLKHEMQREAAPFVASAQIPVRHDGVCKAAQNLRSYIVVLAGLMDSKCLNEEQYKNLAASLDSSMKEANGNIGLYCN